MTALQIVTLYAISGIITVWLGVFAALQYRKAPSGPSFIALCLSLAWWLLCNILALIVPHAEMAVFFYDAKYAGVAFAPVAMLFFATRFLHIERWRLRSIGVLLCVIPLVTTILAVTNPLHGLFRTEVRLIEEGGRRIEASNELWFWVHTIYSYALTLFSSLLVAVNIRKTPKVYRVPLYVLLVGSLLTIAANVLIVFFQEGSRLDITPITLSFNLLFLYWAMSNSRTSDYLHMAHNEIFHTMQTGIFILDADRIVLEMNRTAQAWCDALAVGDPVGMAFDTLIERALSLNGGKFIEGRWDSDRDVLVTIQGRQGVFSLTESVLKDASGAKIGSYVSLNDDTQARTLIDRLEQSVGVDALTGIGNRRAYEKSIEELDGPEYLPLSVIVGDVNNLKMVNDQFGHEEGDKLLCAVADILKREAPSDGLAARIGGDEFVLVLPHADEVRAQEAIRAVRMGAAAYTGLSVTPNIALGASTKYRREEDLTSLIKDADEAMYQDKRNDRRRRARD